MQQVTCHLCGHSYAAVLGRYGCPDCCGEGLETGDEMMTITTLTARWILGEYVCTPPGARPGDSWFSRDGDLWILADGTVPTSELFQECRIQLINGPRNGETVL